MFDFTESFPENSFLAVSEYGIAESFWNGDAQTGLFRREIKEGVITESGLNAFLIKSVKVPPGQYPAFRRVRQPQFNHPIQSVFCVQWLFCGLISFFRLSFSFWNESRGF